MLKAIYKSRFSYVVCRMVVCGNCRWWGSFFIHELITILWCYDFSVMRRWGESKGALAVSWLSKKEHSPKYSLLSRSIPSWLKRWRVVWGAWSISCKNSEQTVCGLRFIVECMDSYRRDYDVVKFCCELRTAGRNFLMAGRYECCRPKEAEAETEANQAPLIERILCNQ